MATQLLSAEQLDLQLLNDDAEMIVYVPKLLSATLQHPCPTSVYTNSTASVVASVVARVDAVAIVVTEGGSVGANDVVCRTGCAGVGCAVVGCDVVGCDVVGCDVVGCDEVDADVVGSEVSCRVVVCAEVGCVVDGCSVVGCAVVGSDVVGCAVVGCVVVGCAVVGCDVVGCGVVGCCVVVKAVGASVSNGGNVPDSTETSSRV